MILVDTSVWSQALRRPRRPATSSGLGSPGGALLRRIVEAGEAVAVPGPVVQELLSGLRSEAQSTRLSEALAPFPTLLARRSTHVLAARMTNACRRHGVTCSSIDALIAALAVEHTGILLTSDEDFARIAEHTDLRVQLVAAG